MFRILFVALALSASIISSAQAAMPIEISSTASDTTGKRLVFAIKERVRSSESMELTFDQSKPRLQVFIVTLDPSVGDNGYSTAYSVVITWKNPAEPFAFLLNQYVGTCGGNRVDEAADGIVADISEQSDIIISALQNSITR